MKTNIINDPVKESPESFNQKALNLFYIRKIRKMISGDPSLARAAFNHLKKNQKRLLLIASGLPPQSDDWLQLNDSQIKQLLTGIKRLRIIVDAFSVCDSTDFQIAYQPWQKRYQRRKNALLAVNQQAKFIEEHMPLDSTQQRDNQA